MCVLWGHRLRYLRGGGEATWVSMGGGSHEGEEAGEGTGAEGGWWGEGWRVGEGPLRGGADEPEAELEV